MGSKKSDCGCVLLSNINCAVEMWTERRKYYYDLISNVLSWANSQPPPTSRKSDVGSKCTFQRPNVCLFLTRRSSILQVSASSNGEHLPIYHNWTLWISPHLPFWALSIATDDSLLFALKRLVVPIIARAIEYH